MDLFASPPAEDALDLADRLWHWMLTSGVRIVVILLVAALLSAAASWPTNFAVLFRPRLRCLRILMKSSRKPTR